jgi:hypothetical protein
MGHTLSDRQQQQRIMASPLAHLTDWHLRVRCSRCVTQSDLAGNALLCRYGGTHRVVEIVQRLRCSKCPGAAVDG